MLSKDFHLTGEVGRALLGLLSLLLPKSHKIQGGRSNSVDMQLLFILYRTFSWYAHITFVQNDRVQRPKAVTSTKYGNPSCKLQTSVTFALMNTYGEVVPL